MYMGSGLTGCLAKDLIWPLTNVGTCFLLCHMVSEPMKGRRTGLRPKTRLHMKRLGWSWPKQHAVISFLFSPHPYCLPTPLNDLHIGKQEDAVEDSHYPDASVAHLSPCQVHGSCSADSPGAIISHHYLQAIVLLSLPNKINNKQRLGVAAGCFVTNIKEGEIKVAHGITLKSYN